MLRVGSLRGVEKVGATLQAAFPDPQTERLTNQLQCRENGENLTLLPPSTNFKGRRIISLPHGSANFLNKNLALPDSEMNLRKQVCWLGA